MHRRLNKVLGYYVPSFFEMHVDTECEDLTITNLPLRDQTVLFHEYIHFLQDITTYYGLNGIYVHSEYLHSVVNRIYRIPTAQFEVPFEIKDNNDNVLLNKQIRNFTLGDADEISTFNVKQIMLDQDKLIENKYFKSIQSVLIQTKTDDYISFGGIAIMESMAYIMERLCSPTGYVKSPEFPYLSAEKVAEYYSAEFAANPLMILALCDMSLQYSNPGACYVRVLDGIRAGRLAFSTPESVYDYFYAQETAMADGSESGDLLENFKLFLNIVNQQLHSYLKDLPDMDDYYAWIDHLIAFVIDWREHDRYFLLNMARTNNLLKNNHWGKAIHDIGSPLMSNNKNQYSKIPPHGMEAEMNVEFFKAIYEIERLFEAGSMSCSMYEWCKKSPKSTPNELCTSAPWEKSNEEYLCPYAFTWKHWNLRNRIPVN